MSLYRKTQSIKTQIVDTQRLLEMVLDHPFMSAGLSERLNLLKQELESLPKESFEPKIQLLFSGNAVLGSHGIKSSFVGKTIIPFQEMVKTQTVLFRFGKVGKRGKTKNGVNNDLFLTALPVGSFGIELSQLESSDLFDGVDVSNAMKSVMRLIENSTKDDDTFETAIEGTPKRSLTNLKKFLQEIYYESSILKMESGELGIEISKDKIIEAYNRASSVLNEEEEVVINGTFRGMLLDSGKFEMQDENGYKMSGFISEDLDEEKLVEYNNTFLNLRCKIHLKIHKTKFRTGNQKTGYELLDIIPE
jgi:hypothetical protein